MSKLYFTMGLPRSGKSTIANKWAAEKPMRAIVSSDNIRLALSGKRYEPLAETMVFATKHIMIRSLLARGFDVMVDGTHSTDISLERLFEIDINAIPLYVDTDADLCRGRALEHKQDDVVPAINRIEDNLKKMGFYEIKNQTHEMIYYDNKLHICGHTFDPSSRACLTKIQEIRKSIIERNLYNNKDDYKENRWWTDSNVLYMNGDLVGYELNTTKNVETLTFKCQRPSPQYSGNTVEMLMSHFGY